MEEEGLDVVQIIGARRRPRGVLQLSVVEMRDQGEKAPSWSGTASVGTPSSKESENTKYDEKSVKEH